MEKKYTPGPWKAKFGKAALNSDNLNAGGIIGNDDVNQVVAEICNVYDFEMVETDRIDFDTMYANAALIAAAPDLLEALEELLKSAVILSDDYLQGYKYLPNEATISGWGKARWLKASAAGKQARAAISKATTINQP